MNLSCFKNLRRITGPVRNRCSGARRSDPPGGSRVFAEGLESRMMFAVTVSHNTTTNILTITGDANANAIDVYQLNSTDPDELYVVADNVLHGAFNVDADLTLIKVDAGSGIDNVFFSSNAHGVLGGQFGIPVSVPAEIHGDYDNDFLYGTDQADTIWGDFGDDQLWGAGGNDVMYGGYGSSITETGEDILTGDAGDDSMFGEGGADSFFNSGNGADYLDGGDGSDTADSDLSDGFYSVEIFR